MKFKVGDKVRVVKNIDQFGRVITRPTSLNYIGEVHTIVGCDGVRSYPYLLDDCKGLSWCDEELDLVHEEKIVITTDGKTTTATKYCGDGKKVTATANCSPEDTFDFNIGAKLAMERLMKAIEPPKYYNGKVVCVDLQGVNHGCYTVGKIYEFADGKLTIDSGEELPYIDRICSFEDWEKYSGSKWLEIKE